MKFNYMVVALLLLTLMVVAIQATDPKGKKGSKPKITLYKGPHKRRRRRRRDRCRRYKTEYKCKAAYTKFASRKTNCIWNSKDQKCASPNNKCQLYHPMKGHSYGCEKHKCYKSIGHGIIKRHHSKKAEKCVIGSFKNRCLMNKNTHRCDCRCHRVRNRIRLPHGFKTQKRKKTSLDIGKCNGICPHYYKNKCKPVYTCVTIVKKVRVKYYKPYGKKGKKHGKHGKKDKKHGKKDKKHGKKMIKHKKSKNISKTRHLLYKNIYLSIRVITKCDCMSKKYMRRYRKKETRKCGKACVTKQVCGKWCSKSKKGKKSICINKYCPFTVYYKNPFQKKKLCGPPSCGRKCEFKFAKCIYRKGSSFRKCYKQFIYCKKVCKCSYKCRNHENKPHCIKHCLKPKCHVLCPKGLKRCTHKCKKYKFYQAIKCNKRCQKKNKKCKKYCCSRCHYYAKHNRSACYGYCKPKIHHCVRRTKCKSHFKRCITYCKRSKSKLHRKVCSRKCKAQLKRCPHECCINQCGHLNGHAKRKCHKKCYVITGPYFHKCKKCRAEHKKCLKKLSYIKASDHVIKRLKQKCNRRFFRCSVKCRCKHTCAGKKGDALKYCLRTCTKKHKKKIPHVSPKIRAKNCIKKCKGRGIAKSICKWSCKCNILKDQSACSELRDCDDCDICTHICNKDKYTYRMAQTAFEGKQLRKMCGWCKSEDGKQECSA